MSSTQEKRYKNLEWKNPVTFLEAASFKIGFSIFR